MQGFEYHVDIVFCIDATASMKPVLDLVKDNAVRFYSDVVAALKEKDKTIDRMRARVIAFRDLYVDGADALAISSFFAIPESSAEFETFVRSLKPMGGGDEPESALEALALAVSSDWTTAGSKRRHVIVLWTDASAHRLEKSAETRPMGYPTGIPKTLDELTDAWSGQTLSQSSKRLIIFAPDADPWSVIGNDASGWENVIWYESRAGAGLDDLTYREIINTIQNSLG